MLVTFCSIHGLNSRNECDDPICLIHIGWLKIRERINTMMTHFRIVSVFLAKNFMRFFIDSIIDSTEFEEGASHLFEGQLFPAASPPAIFASRKSG